VMNMWRMFIRAAEFEQNLCAWTINPGTTTTNMFDGTNCTNKSDPSDDNACFDCSG